MFSRLLALAATTSAFRLSSVGVGHRVYQPQLVAPTATSPVVLHAVAAEGASWFGGKKAAATPKAVGDKITYDEVRAALRTWCDGIVEIGQVFQDNGDFRAKAMEMIESNYAFTHDMGEGNQLLFKPTKASEHPFRSTYDEFVSYFVGDGKYSEDGGFAITPWVKIRFDMHGVYITDASATVMGNYYFTGLDGSETKVEYTFQFVRVKKPAGKLKIILQHSSLPFSP